MLGDKRQFFRVVFHVCGTLHLYPGLCFSSCWYTWYIEYMSVHIHNYYAGTDTPGTGVQRPSVNHYSRQTRQRVTVVPLTYHLAGTNCTSTTDLPSGRYYSDQVINKFAATGRSGFLRTLIIVLYCLCQNKA